MTRLVIGGTPVTLATHGPLTIALRCFADMGGTTAWVTVASSTDNSSALGIETDGDTVGEVAFKGSGCAISKASASMMTQFIKGKSREEAEEWAKRFPNPGYEDGES